MEMATLNRSMNALRNLAGQRRAKRLGERCELCAMDLSADHEHLFEPVYRKVICSCSACSFLFSGSDAKYKRVPRRVRALHDFRMTDQQWDDLAIPITMAFFFSSSPEARVVALYPSPAGPVESLLQLDAWNDIVQENPALEKMEPDVEALLVNRTGVLRGAGPSEYFVAPIDECYKLVGVIRGNWRGFSGGTEVWREIAGFFQTLREKACPT